MLPMGYDLPIQWGGRESVSRSGGRKPYHFFFCNSFIISVLADIIRLVYY